MRQCKTLILRGCLDRVWGCKHGFEAQQSSSAQALNLRLSLEVCHTMISHSMLLFLIGNNGHARGCYERYLQSADTAYSYMASAIQMFISPFLSEPHTSQQPTEIIGLFWPKFLLQLQNSMTSVTCYYQRLGQLYQHRTVSTVPLGSLSEINGLKAIFLLFLSLNKYFFVIDTPLRNTKMIKT